MQKVVIFKRMSFWTSEPDIDALNSKIAALNEDGWRVAHIVPTTNVAGLVRSYTLLLEA